MMRPMRAVLVGLVLGMLSSAGALAFVPKADRTVKAIAAVNRASGRTDAIQFDLTMRVGDRDPVAKGELISHPSGLARLELRGFSGRIDRYLLSGSELLAAKDGQRLDRPQPMLQPIFLLQPASETTLRAALRTFGIQSEWIGLAPCGDQDCFVIGDPRIASPRPGSAVSAEGVMGAEIDEEMEEPSKADAQHALIPRLWVDTRDLQVRRIDRRSGVFVMFGPIATFEKLQVPSWFEIHEPGEPPIHFDVDRAVQVNAPPQAFSQKWLLSPLDTEPGAGSGPQSP
jgi:hypothetical protein